jgi:hypothetical protein
MGVSCLNALFETDHQLAAMSLAKQIDAVEASDSDFLVHRVNLLFNGWEGTGAVCVLAKDFHAAVISDIVSPEVRRRLEDNYTLSQYVVTLWVSLRQTDFCHIENVGIARADEWLSKLSVKAVASDTAVVSDAAEFASRHSKTSAASVNTLLQLGVMNFHHSLVLQLCSPKQEAKLLAAAADFDTRAASLMAIVVYSGIGGYLGYTGSHPRYKADDPADQDGALDDDENDGDDEKSDSVPTSLRLKKRTLPDGGIQYELASAPPVPLAGSVLPSAASVAWPEDTFRSQVPDVVAADPLLWALDLYDMKAKAVKSGTDGLSADRSKTRLMSLVPGSCVWERTDSKTVTRDQLVHAMHLCELFERGSDELTTQCLCAETRPP